MLVQPETECILDDAGDESSGLARREPLLRLARELRVLACLHRQHEADAVPDVFRRELEAARQQVAKFAELADRVRQADAQAVDVRTALRRRDQVDVAFLDARPAVEPPRDRPVGGFLLALRRCR